MPMSSFDFTDKTVIVTGGGTGIGFEIAKSFVLCGAKVTIAGRRKDVLEEALLQIKKKIPKSEDNIISLTCDMSNEQSVNDLFQTVQSTFNNTIISIADTSGNVISWASAGQKGFKGSRKSTPYAAQIAADAAASKALEFGMKVLSVEVKGPGAGRETALRALQSRGFKIISIKDTTPIPHNGTRPPKRRRV